MVKSKNDFIKVLMSNFDILCNLSTDTGLNIQNKPKKGQAWQLILIDLNDMKNIQIQMTALCVLAFQQ